jgi:endo-1,4-beta-xylanase
MRTLRGICEMGLETWSTALHAAIRSGVLVALLFLASVSGFAQSDTIQTNVPALKDVFKHDFRIGCLLSYRHVGFATDPVVPGQSAVGFPNGGYLIKFHMNNMSPGNNMKPVYTVDTAASKLAWQRAATQAEKDSIDAHPAIKFNGDLVAQLNWAQRQGFTFRGHTLVWHSQTPGTCFFRSGYASTGTRLTKDQMTKRLEGYISEVIRQIHVGWPGVLVAMDVVNEAINDGTGTDRVTGNEWYTTFGDNTFIMKAFEFARKYTQMYGETQMKLYYNDYNTNVAAKATGIVRLCGPIFRAGFLDGIGMQDHDQLTSPAAAEWIATYSKFDTICTEMSVTELDVATGLASPPDSILQKQANQYGQLFKCFVERSYFSGRGKVISVSKDGLNDASTFVTNQATSLWDGQNKCKPAFFAVANVGLRYNAVDSMLRRADSLTQISYTQESWARLTSMATRARSVMSRNYSVTISAADSLGVVKDSLKAALDGLTRIVNDVTESTSRPTTFSLSQNYPNPFNPNSDIRYQISEFRIVRLCVYDVLGREVAVLVDEAKQPGAYTVRFDGSGLASGVYLYRLTSGSFTQTRKMVLAR